MQLSDSIEVAIGISFLFMMLSLVLTALNETIEGFVKMRGRRLYRGVCELLSDPKVQGSGVVAADAIYRHPLIQGVMRGTIDPKKRGKLPSYLPSRSFALALMDQAISGALRPPAVAGAPASTLPGGASRSAQLALAVEGIENAQLRDALQQALSIGAGDLDKVREYLEGWYDSAMDRVSGWYKRYTQWILLGLGFFVAIILNVNALSVANSLTTDATLRRAVVAQAENAQSVLGNDPKAVRAEIEKTGLPIGWNNARTQAAAGDPSFVIRALPGWAVTAFAISLGAPFWFDVLNRLMVIRATVKPTEKSQDEAPQDPQRKAGGGAVLVVRDGAEEPVVESPPGPPNVRDSDIFNELPTAAERRFEDEDDAAEAAR